MERWFKGHSQHIFFAELQPFKIHNYCILKAFSCMKPLPSHIFDTFVKICLKYLPRFIVQHQQYAHVHCHIIIAFLQVVVPKALA